MTNLKAQLVLSDEEKVYDLDQKTVVIGRSLDADIQLPIRDVFLSRKQACIEFVANAYHLVHTGSNPNTTRVNDETIIDRILLKSGDRIEFGSMEFVFEIVDVSAATPEGYSDNPRSPILQDAAVFSETEGNLETFEEVESRDLNIEGEAIRDAIRNAEDSNAMAEHVQSLFRATSELDPFAGEDALIEKAFDILEDMLTFDQSALLLEDSETDELALKHARPHGDDKPELMISRTVVQRVMGHGVALFSSDIRSESDLGSQMSVILKNIMSVICMPLEVEKEILGVWYIDTRHPVRRYTREHLAFFGILANFLARSIANARLLKKSEQEVVFRNTIGRYFSPAVVHELEKGSGDADILSGREAEVCVMFTDVRNFSTISQKLHPRELLDLLNEHFTVAADAILRMEGTIDKYIGDSVMAFWGAPVAVEHASVRCVKAAIEIQQSMEQLREKFKAEGKIPFHIGIGINTGMAIAGNIGSIRRMDYSLVSDAVNLAERLCEVALPDQILISQATYNEVAPYFPGEIEQIAPIRLKNMGEAAPFNVTYTSRG